MLRSIVVLFYAFLSCGLSSLFGLGLGDSISASRIEVGEEEYWLHVVAKGETLYAISRKYNVPQSAIAAANPQIYYGIKESQLLRIPIPEDQRTKTVNEGYTLHVVSAGESLYSISRQYGVSVTELRRENALVSDTIQPNMLLRIPVYRDRVSTTQQRVYVVQKGDGVYGIAKRNGVTQENLLEANPWIRERQLEVGDKLIIPNLAEVGVTALEKQVYEVQKGEGVFGIAQRFGITLADLSEANPWIRERQLEVGDKLIIPSSAKVGDSSLGQQPRMLDVFCDTTHAFPKWKTLNIALALPFELGKVQSASIDDELYDVSGASLRGMAANTRYLDFYQGVLLALNDFRLKGYNIRLVVFDTQHSPAVVQKLVQSDTLRQANLIIGPVYPKNLSLVSQYAAQYSIPMVSPLSGKSTAVDVNPYLFQANPSLYTQLKTLVEKTLKSGTTRVVVLREESLADMEMADKLEEYLNAQLQQITPSPTLEVLRYPKGEATSKRSAQLRKLFDGGKSTKVFIPSNSEPFVSDLLGQLNSMNVLKKADSIEIYGMSRWLKMRNLDLAQLGALKITLFSPFYVDYQSQSVCDFVDNYRSLYRCEPTQFAFQGYDIVKYFVGAICRYGTNFHICLPRYNVPLMQNCFDFRAISDLGSYESRAVYLLRYDLEEGLIPLE